MAAADSEHMGEMNQTSQLELVKLSVTVPGWLKLLYQLTQKLPASPSPLGHAHNREWSSKLKITVHCKASAWF